ncbi:hypothetical protein GGU10DRAFT_356132 [Lentinula aff. detonsa]|uniref:Uncharacterized protein n=1 Tax=Lentinula aff. detonsa TaxID=2804958 RepID=A0AA38NPI0_9AGAR|nr:hypothetical protein GGU10DRAFT_356132 [Lentinula aff. detonsa]
MAQLLTLLDQFTPEDFSDVESTVETEPLDMNEIQLAHDYNQKFEARFLDAVDTDSGESEDELFSEFTDLNESPPGSHNHSENFSAQSVVFRSSSGSSSFNEAYDSVTDELDEEPTKLDTSVHVLDEERQRHSVAVTELEDRHAKDMIELAVEMQALRNTQDALREEGLVQTARVQTLLGEKDELQSQSRTMSDLNATLAQENAKLSLQLLEGQTRTVNLEHDCAEALAAQISLSSQLTNRTRELDEAKNKFAGQIQILTIARDNASAEAARLRNGLEGLAATARQEHDDLVDSNNNLRNELDSERKHDREVAARSADQIRALTVSRGNLQADLDRIRRERVELSKSSRGTIDSLQNEIQAKARELQTVHTQAASAADCSSKEIRTLLLAKETIQAECQKLEGIVSGLKAVVHDDEQRIIAVQEDLDTCRKSSLEDISGFQKERNSLQENVAMLKKKLEEVQMLALRNAAKMEGKLNTLQSEKDDLLKAKNRDVATFRRVMQARIDPVQAVRSEVSNQVKAKDSELDTHCSETSNLKRELENNRVKQQRQETRTKSEVCDLRSQADRIEQVRRRVREANLAGSDGLIVGYTTVEDKERKVSAIRPEVKPSRRP